MIYSEFEKDFKNQSIMIKFFKYKRVMFAILYFGLLIISYFSKKLEYPIINGSVYIIGNLILAYILYYFMVVRKIDNKNTSFWKIVKNIKLCRENIKENDFKVVKKLCDKHEIVYEKQVSEMISHYRNAKSNTSFLSICLTITSIAISIIPMFISNKNYESEYLITIVLAVILIIALFCYITYSFYDTFIKAATKNELYKSLEEYLSEIYIQKICFEK